MEEKLSPMLAKEEIEKIEKCLSAALNDGKVHESEKEINSVLKEYLHAPEGSVCKLFEYLGLKTFNTAPEIGTYQYDCEGTKVALACIVFKNKNPKTGDLVESDPEVVCIKKLSKFYPSSEKLDPKSYLYMLVVEFDPFRADSTKVCVQLIETVPADIFNAPKGHKTEFTVNISKFNLHQNFIIGGRDLWMRTMYSIVLSHSLDLIGQDLDAITKLAPKTVESSVKCITNHVDDVRNFMSESTQW